MQEIRYVKVNKTEVPVLISDEKEALHAARAAGRAVVGLWTPEKGWDELEGTECVAMEPEAITDELLERTARRFLGFPWHICTTRRLLIREICGDDFDEIWDNRMGRIFGSVEKLEAYTRHQYRFYGFGFWALADRENGGIVGVAGLTVPEEKTERGLELYRLELGAFSDSGKTGEERTGSTDRAAPDRRGDTGSAGQAASVELELGYHIFPPYRRRGYAEESCRAILEYARTELEVDRIVLRIRDENKKSRKLALKLGFTRA